jgi:hypothetical protein
MVALIIFTNFELFPLRAKCRFSYGRKHFHLFLYYGYAQQFAIMKRFRLGEFVTLSFPRVPESLEIAIKMFWLQL